MRYFNQMFSMTRRNSRNYRCTPTWWLTANYLFSMKTVQFSRKTRPIDRTEWIDLKFGSFEWSWSTFLRVVASMTTYCEILDNPKNHLFLAKNYLETCALFRAVRETIESDWILISFHAIENVHLMMCWACRCVFLILIESVFTKIHQFLNSGSPVMGDSFRVK